MADLGALAIMTGNREKVGASNVLLHRSFGEWAAYGGHELQSISIDIWQQFLY